MVSTRPRRASPVIPMGNHLPLHFTLVTSAPKAFALQIDPKGAVARQTLIAAGDDLSVLHFPHSLAEALAGGLPGASESISRGTSGWPIALVREIAPAQPLVESNEGAYNQATFSFKFCFRGERLIVPETLLNPGFTSFETVTVEPGGRFLW